MAGIRCGPKPKRKFLLLNKYWAPLLFFSFGERRNLWATPSSTSSLILSSVVKGHWWTLGTTRDWTWSATWMANKYPLYIAPAPVYFLLSEGLTITLCNWRNSSFLWLQKQGSFLERWPTRVECLFKCTSRSYRNNTVGGTEIIHVTNLGSIPAPLPGATTSFVLQSFIKCLTKSLGDDGRPKWR